MTLITTLHAFTESAELVRQGREWLIDCGADPEQVEAANARTIGRTVDSHYDGGLLQFLDDADWHVRVYAHELAGVGYMD